MVDLSAILENDVPINLLNANGQLLKSYHFNAGDLVKISIENLQTGIHYLQIESSTETTIAKFIKLE